MKLPRVESKSKVVLSMYTTDTNLENNTTIKSLLDQTVHPDQIIIVTDSDAVTIPDFLKKDSIIVKQNAGTLNKTSAFLSPLLTQKNASTKIIVVVDGVVYGPDFIESLVEESENNPESVIFVEGYDARQYINGKIESSSPNVINVASGVLIRPSFFKDCSDVISSDVLKEAPNAVVSAMVLKNKVPKRQLKYREIFHAKPKISNQEKLALEYYGRYFQL
jgi:hypothetical protein